MNAITSLFWCGMLSSPLFPAEFLPDLAAEFLVARASNASASWRGFAGFIADLEVEQGGRKSSGRVVVDPEGLVHIEHLSVIHRSWAIERLGTVVRGRLSAGSDTKKSWTLATPQDCREPRTRGVYAKGDPFGQCYWIRDDQVQVIDSRSAKQKHRLTTLRTEKNPDGKFLPTALVLLSWNSRTEELESSETTLLSWRRVGRFDLPTAIDVLPSGSCAETAAGRMVLSNHFLFESNNAHLAGR